MVLPRRRIARAPPSVPSRRARRSTPPCRPRTTGSREGGCGGGGGVRFSSRGIPGDDDHDEWWRASLLSEIPSPPLSSSPWSSAAISESVASRLVGSWGERERSERLIEDPFSCQDAEPQKRSDGLLEVFRARTRHFQNISPSSEENTSLSPLKISASRDAVLNPTFPLAATEPPPLQRKGKGEPGERGTKRTHRSAARG